MSSLLRTFSIVCVALIGLALAQFVVSTNVPIVQALDPAPTLTPEEPEYSVDFLVTTGTYQDFDQPGTGTPYRTATLASPPAAQILSGGVLETGNFMRLAFIKPVSPTATNHNSLAFTRTNVGAFPLIVADFDFRLAAPEELSVGRGRADGFGFALLNTAHYGTTGTVTLTAAAEEPSFLNSLGIGFDIHRNSGELNNNHLSVHFQGTKREFDVAPLDLADRRWIHARLILRPGGGFADVSVILTPCGGAPVTVVNQYVVPGLAPYEGRVHFAARSGNESADQDLDNINVQFRHTPTSAAGLSATCYPSTEIAGTQSITITRIGSLTSTASVTYTTLNATAIAGTDYVATSGTLTFAVGEATKVIAVPILNDTLSEGEKRFLVTLGRPTNTVLAGPAVAKVVIADEERGLWSSVITLPIVPIHMNLLPTGQILMWDRHVASQGWDGNPRLWDMKNNTISTAALPGFDIFCTGHSFLPDGRLFVTGGHIADNVGENKARIYDPLNNTWLALPNMNAGRWYPSNVTLPNGDVVVMAGTITPGVVNTYTQVWQASTNTWRTLTSAPQGGLFAYAIRYPWNFFAPNGRVFVAGPQQLARYLDTSGTGAWINVVSSTLRFRDYGSAVMFGDNKIMIVGGSAIGNGAPSASAEIINLKASSPTWQLAAPMSIARRQHNATVLPDGKVLVTGGSSLTGSDNVAGAVLYPELYDPATNTWSPLSPYARYRGYHSNALLLPDARVLIAGGGHPNPTGGREEKNAEIYSPPYLFKGPRPTIQCAPDRITYDQPFQVTTPDAIEKMTLIRLPAVTHGFNQNQHYRELTFEALADGAQARLPAQPDLVPPGHYMLFIVNSSGVPSVASIVQVSAVLTPDNACQAPQFQLYLPGVTNP